MSLIIEALKRARDDAVRRQTASRGLPLAPVPRLRGRNRWLALALVPLAAALVVCILLLVDLYRRMPQAAPGIADSSQASLESETPSPSSTPLSRDESDPVTTPQRQAATTDLVPSSAERSSPSPGIPPPFSRPSREESLELPSPQTQSIEPQRAAPAPTRITRSNASPGAREFVGQAKLRDGQLIDLEGIAWSESDPFALLNGQVVGVGELIRSYRVTEIQQDQVVLEQDDDRVVLRLK